MTREELIHDLRVGKYEMDRLAIATGSPAPPPEYGMAMLTADATMDLIKTGQTLPLSRRYIEAIIAELSN